jgi:hypothetical protein
MERAAMLAQSTGDKSLLKIFDTGGTAEGAAKAAMAARKGRATVILGPLLSGEAAAVMAVTKNEIPVLAFSNDAALRESGAFLLGITARQNVAAILAYAADRGIRRVSVGGENAGWGRQVRAAAEIEGPTSGIAISQLPADDLNSVPNSIVSSPDGYPDAVLMPDSQSLTRMAPQLAEQGIQALGAFPELDLSQDQMRPLEGTWLAAPDPATFSDFSRNFEQRMGTRPGLIAALAFDAVTIANQMRSGGGTDRSAVLSSNGFTGVCGHVRFRDDGSATRAMAILELTGRGVRRVAG